MKNPYNLQALEAIVEKHSLNKNLMYGSNALAGEVGEVCNVIKRLQMINMKPEWIRTSKDDLGIPNHTDLSEQLRVELSDVLFYLTRLALTNGQTISDFLMEFHFL